MVSSSSGFTVFFRRDRREIFANDKFESEVDRKLNRPPTGCFFFKYRYHFPPPSVSFRFSVFKRRKKEMNQSVSPKTDSFNNGIFSV